MILNVSLTTKHIHPMSVAVIEFIGVMVVIIPYKTTASIVVGKMDVMWFSRFGERGRIQTGPLQTSVS